MRVTIEVDATELKQIQQITGQKKKSPAITQALSAFIRQQQKRQFIERALSGQTDYRLTNEELEARDLYETH
ncbi:MAG: type II toxin-antitoxin system VapB family antitoxin [Verrucomicrobia bacterium]|nr:type II toxin-antitoxin system VapB family antitoxin [Verrucomicrobiota bacterium]